ncbi:hypothetical protein [Roseateles noduli]|uniref:hypothetical protein n=1 Tax=Roseateles noduli TaxID=2052484 RepID=UPI003D65CAF0
MSNVIHLFGTILRSPKSVQKEDSSADLINGTPEQLSLSFAAPAVLVQVLCQDFEGGVSFVDFLDAIAPRFIADMRVSPRLDFICPSRNQTLEFLAARQISYRDILGRIGAKSYDDATARRNEALTALSAFAEFSDEGPILSLFDDQTFLQNCSTAMQGLFEPMYMQKHELERVIFENSRQQM